MKTIFRSTIAALMFAAIIALGAVAGFSQDPCADADGQTAANQKITDLFQKKDIDSMVARIDAGKQFMDKYGACESAKQLSDYLKLNIPKWETTLQGMRDAGVKKALTAKFDAGLAAKNWDDVYSAGKELLTKFPDEFRVAEIVLGSIGLEETAKNPRVTKWNDDTLRFAKQSIQDLESGKLTKYGLAPYASKSKDDALGWMNYTIGYILMFDKKDKKNALGYLYKATQLESDTKTHPDVYKSIASYYFDDVVRLDGEGRALAASLKVLKDSVNATDTPEVKQQKIDAFKAKNEELKAKVGVLNGTAERAMDAYSRAYTFSLAVKPANKAYSDSLYKTLGELYNVRFDKMDGLEAWVKAAPAKPFPDPTSPVVPVIDPEPAATSEAPATPVKPAAKPATPGAKPGASTKQQSVVSNSASSGGNSVATSAKPVVKKKGTK